MLLSEEKLRELAHRRATKYTHRSDPRDCSYGFTGAHLDDLVRDIAAVLAEQQKQEPVAWRVICDRVLLFDDYKEAVTYCAPDEAPEPLYTAPAPEGMVMVPREPTEAMLKVMAKLQFHAPQERYRAMIAAAEKGAGK